MRYTAPRSNVVLALVVACTLTGCFRSIGRKLGDGAVEAVSERSGQLVGPLRDSLVHMVGRLYDDSLRPRLDRSLTRVFDTVSLRLTTIEDETATHIEGRLTDALANLLATNTTVARESLRVAIGSWVAEAGRASRAEVAPVLADAAEEAVARAVTTLNTGLDGPLRVTLVSLVKEIADTVRASAAQVTREPFFTSILKRIGLVGGLVAGAIVVAIVGVFIFVVLSLRNSRKALDAVTTAVRDRGDPELRDEVQRQASARQVEGWLHEYLAKRNLLATGGRDAP